MRQGAVVLGWKAIRTKLIVTAEPSELLPTRGPSERRKRHYDLPRLHLGHRLRLWLPPVVSGNHVMSNYRSVLQIGTARLFSSIVCEVNDVSGKVVWLLACTASVARQTIRLLTYLHPLPLQTNNCQSEIGFLKIPQLYN